MNHVGRPTNEELRKRNYKKIIKVFLPTFLLVVVLIIINERQSIALLMGNSLENCVEKCSKGWELSDGVCYLKEDTPSEKTDALLVGDVNGDHNINIDDYSMIKKDINTDKKLTEEEKIIYDLNQDGIIDDEDISMDYFVSTRGQTIFSKTYKCLNETKKHTVDDQGYEVEQTITYELKGLYCYANTTKIKKTKVVKVCHLSEYSEHIYSKAYNYSPKQGDIVFFSTDGGQTVSQTAIVYQVKNNRLITIEGNIGCQSKDNKECWSKENRNSENKEYHIKHSLVRKKEYLNYQHNKEIIGYIKLSDVTSQKRIKSFIKLANNQLNNTINNYWDDIETWDGEVIINWSSLFIAWSLEKSGINPEKIGWSAGETTWLMQAKKIIK